MAEFNIYTKDKEIVEISPILYFELKGQTYFLYQKKEAEIDEQGYGRVYVTKPVGTYTQVITDLEWRDIKDEVKNIVKNRLHDYPIVVKKRNYHELRGLIVSQYRMFRFDQKLVELLKEEETEEPIIKPRMKEAIRVPDHHEESTNYKELYEMMQKKNKELEEELLDLQNQTMTYQLKYDQIKKILEADSDVMKKEKQEV